MIHTRRVLSALAFTLSLATVAAQDTPHDVPADAAAQDLPLNVRDFGAVGDGTTDDLPAIQKALAASAGHAQHLLFPAGTYAISAPLVIPGKMQITGVGRGDAGGPNTVIKALPNFPVHEAVIEMGTPPGPNMGVVVENLAIDGAFVAGTCLANHYSQELSFGRNLLLVRCGAFGLDVSGGPAQNSGPFENIEYESGDDPAINAQTICVRASGAGAFRGVHGLTCNAGEHYASRPAVALLLDGSGTFENIHVEHFTSAVVLGNRTAAADGLIFANGSFGPDVVTGLTINPAAGNVNNQNLTILGIACTGCTTLVNDLMTGTKINDTSLGWYLLGNGGGKTKAVLSSNFGVANQVFGPFRAPQMQLTSSGAQPACSAALRGTFWFFRSPGGESDHLQVCRKNNADAYSWTNVF